MKTTTLDHLPLISFIIPVRNGAKTIGACVRSIFENDYPADRIEVLVVDNGSTDGSPRVAAAAGANVLSLPGRCPSELRNRAAAIARGDVLAFIDADHEIDWRWARSAVATLLESGVGGVGALYHCPPSATWVQRQYDRLRGHGIRRGEAEWLASGNLAVWRSAFRKVEGFDSSLETCEDLDLCGRLRQAGYRLMSDPGLYSTHFGDPRTLVDLFKAELWRGRDNVRVTLRTPMSVRSIASLVLPALDLVLIGVAIATLVSMGAQAAVVAATFAALSVIAFAATRALSKVRPSGLTWLDVCQVLVVAAVYDLGRAFALVVRVRHDTRAR